YKFQFVPVSRPMQRRHTIDIRYVDVNALLQQRLRGGYISIFRRVDQPEIPAGGKCRCHSETGGDTESKNALSAHYSSILPVLSPYLSVGMPATSRTLSIRFDRGVSFTRMCRFPFTLPAAPPTVRIGRFVWIC